MNRLRSFIRDHRTLAAVVGVLILSAVVVGAALFQPWRLFTSSIVNEALPALGVSTGQPSDGGTAGAPHSQAVPSQTPPSYPAVVGGGTFQSQEHETTGTAQLLMLPDGSHLLRLENLASSDGPDVKVWLSSQEAGGDWFKYRSGRYVDLGAIKATHGNQNYVVPAGTDVAGLTSVVLWCDRFSVAFGSAPLT
ncbi:MULTISPECIES: DM13 domain-containing protein [unclassified Arthrobacter]|uniref:DM13 domain-containing protein n=1 Tax=unclassified Arthrobacter TaxID=235627 RepID=UPI002882F7C1|nr:MULTISPECIES: DM13 domain-containing protein [unclassified Arthrobacter]